MWTARASRVVLGPAHAQGSEDARAFHGWKEPALMGSPSHRRTRQPGASAANARTEVGRPERAALTATPSRNSKLARGGRARAGRIGGEVAPPTTCAESAPLGAVYPPHGPVRGGGRLPG